MTVIARLKNNNLLISGEIVEVEGDSSVLYFDGVDDWISILNTDNRLQPNQQFCWEMWFKLESYTQYNTLMGFNSNNLDFMRMDSTTSFRSHFWTSSDTQEFINPTGFPSVNDGEWHHVATVWDGANGEKFCLIDGIERSYGTMGAGTQIRDSSIFDNFAVGSSNGVSRFINGWIKEVRMWQKARTQQEIIETMNERLTGNEDGLFVYLPLDEGQGTILTDLASGYEASINGATWQGDVSRFRIDSNGSVFIKGELIENENNLRIQTDGTLKLNELAEGVIF